MFRPKCRVFAVVMLALLASTYLGAEDSLRTNNVSATLLPPLGTNWPGAGDVRTRLSFNVLGGYVGELNGFELGTVFNTERLGGRGFQVAGGFNWAGTDFFGCQLAAGANIVQRDLNVLQLAAGFNLAGQRVNGMQLAAVNVAGRLDGAQLGVVNVTGPGEGVVGGVMNIADDFRGLQLGVVNVTRKMTGIQLGVTNIAHRYAGLQLGLVNIADETQGEAMGLVNVIGNGLHNMCVWADEAAVPCLGWQYGSPHVYNIVALGIQPKRDTLGDRWLVGLGLGGRLDRGRLFLDIDGGGYAVRRTWEWEGGLPGILARLRANGGFRLLDWLAVTAGPTVNAMFVGRTGDGLGPMHRWYLYQGRSGDWQTRVWLGFGVGLQVDVGENEQSSRPDDRQDEDGSR